MADLDGISSGLAALLRGVMPADDGQVSAYLLETPTSPSLQVAGVDADGMEFISFGDPPTIRWVILIEAWLGKVSSIGAQKLLRSLMLPLAYAVESDNKPGIGALFSRLSDDGVVTTDANAPAADSVTFLAFRGQAPVEKTIAGQTAVYLTATWAVEVIA